MWTARIITSFFQITYFCDVDNISSQWAPKECEDFKTKSLSDEEEGLEPQRELFSPQVDADWKDCSHPDFLEEICDAFLFYEVAEGLDEEVALEDLPEQFPPWLDVEVAEGVEGEALLGPHPEFDTPPLEMLIWMMVSS